MAAEHGISNPVADARLLAQITAHIPDAVVATDRELRVTYWNGAAERLSGVTAAEALGQPLTEVYTCLWTGPDAAHDAWQALESSGRWHREHRHARRDGREVWVESTLSVLRDERGERVGVVAFIRDMTARRAADETAERLRARSDHQHRLYETILSSTPDLVYVFGLDHRFTYANQALLALWGKSWDEAIGRNCLELGYEPWHAAMHDAEIEQVIATRRPVRGEVPFNGTQGRRIYDYIFVPVLGGTGEVEAVAGTTRDVTARKLAVDTLRESERRLADANRAKDEFLATLSHELRTPLNALLGWTHMLRAGTLRPELHGRALDAIARNASAQARLVDDLLDVSRIVMGKLPMRSAAFPLGAAIAGAIDAVRPLVSAKRLQLHVGIDPDDDLHVWGDKERLQQVVWNLLSNAVRFTPDGGRIEIDLQADGTDARVAVRDTGEGIDSAFLPHVFERFRQADSTPSRSHGGLGLGLAIVRHFVEAHGGTVTAHSDGPGTGSTFVVRVPVYCASRAPSHRPGGTGDHGTRRLAGARVLIVDDQADARELMQFLLEGHGAEVWSAASAEMALDALRSRTFDVVLADVGMPAQDGYDLIRAIRSSSVHAGLPAIAVTAYVSPQDRDAARAAGYDLHLGKPVQPDELVAALSTIVRLDSDSQARPPGANE